MTRERYAAAIVHHAVNLRPGEDIFIRGPEVTREFGLLVGEAAYQAGARSVRYHFTDPAVLRQLFEHGDLDHITLYARDVSEYFENTIRRRAASVFLCPDFALEPWQTETRRKYPGKYGHFIRQISEIATRFRDLYTNRVLRHTVVPVARMSWAKRLFPGVGPEAALGKLWDHLYRFAQVDKDDGLQRLRKHGEEMQRKAEALNELGIEEIHVSGGKTDLRLRFRPHRWQCEQRQRSGNVEYSRFPSYVLYAPVDNRAADGVVVASNPVRLLNHCLVEGLELNLSKGRVVSSGASSGHDDFVEWISTDACSKQIGMMNLVGDDCPLAGTGMFYGHVNVDDNMTSAICLGAADPTGVLDSESPGGPESSGCNSSITHTSIPLGSPEVSIVASTKTGERQSLIEGGRWVGKLRE